MLWYKAWLETRMRFLICLIVMTGFCSWNVFRMEHGIKSPVNDAFYNSVVHNSDTQIVFWWVAAVSVLTMGGLLREKAVGAATFTLALPYSRTRLVSVRMAVTLFQSLALIVIPWAAVLAVGSMAGKTHSVTQALFHLVLLAGGGVIVFASGFLVSSLVEGEYTAPMLSLGVVIMIALVFGDESLRAWNPIAMMGGAGHYDARAGLLVGPVPWLQIAIFTALAVVMLAASVKAIQAREF